MKSVVWLLCSLLVLPAFAQPTGSLVYRYAYATSRADSSGYQLHLIDPQNPADEQIILLPTSTYVCGTPSPDGRWLLLCYADPNGGSAVSYRGLMLMETPTGSIRQVATILAIDGVVTTHWSPDSRYLVFLNNTRDGYTNYIYTIETNSTIPITVPNDTGLADEIVGEPLFQMWSPDSTHFLVSICLYNNCLLRRLTLLNMPDLSIAAFTEFKTSGDILCDAGWSPDGRYISFGYCYPAMPFQEIYIWDTQQNQMEQLTHFTETPQEEWEADYPPERYANYELFWANAQTLLVSVDVSSIANGGGVDADTYLSEMWAYQFPSGSTMLSSDQFREWAPRPFSEQIAFRADEFMINDQRELQITASDIQIATFDGEQLNTHHTLPSGCNLSWSPYGRVLAYTDVRSVEACYTQEKGFTFWNAETNQSTTYHFSASPQIVGWVAVPDSWVLPIPYYEIGTPTPIPTSSGAG